MFQAACPDVSSYLFFTRFWDTRWICELCRGCTLGYKLCLIVYFVVRMSTICITAFFLKKNNKKQQYLFWKQPHVYACERTATWEKKKKKSTLNYSQVGLQVLLFSTTRACKFCDSQDRAKTGLNAKYGPPFIIKHMIRCMEYAIYLYCSFNYPVLPAFEVRSISSYLMPGEACTCAPGAWILLFHSHLPPFFSPVFLIVLSASQHRVACMVRAEA